MSEPATIEDAIRAFRAADAAWRVIWTEDDADQRPEWDAHEETEHAVLTFPCATMSDVRAKARFFLEDASYDTIKNCMSGGEDTLRQFLRSLIGEAAPAPVTLLELFQQHRQARRVWIEAVRAKDQLRHDDADEATMAAADAETGRLSDLEEESVTAICAYRPQNGKEAPARSRFLMDRFRRDYEFNEEQIQALVGAVGSP